MRALLVCALATACGKPVVAPAPVGPTPTPDPTPTPAITPKDEIDRGAFVTEVNGTVARREVFSIRRLASSHLVLTSATDMVPGSNEGSTGELEVDAQFRPVRASYRLVTQADGKSYEIGGEPLTLEVTRDDGRDPLKLVAKRPIDVYIQGPGFVAMTALCAIKNDVVLESFGDEEVSTEYIEAYVGTAVGDLKRIVMNLTGLDFELVCSGDKLVAGGLAKYGIWFGREDRKADLTALKNAPRPSPHAWKNPQDETERWKTYHTWLVDKKVFVTRDARRRMQRLTAFDVTNGRELAHRDFKTGGYVECVTHPGARLFCIDGETRFMRLIDARTLADVDDFIPVLTAAFPNTEANRWSIDRFDGTVVDVILDDSRMARIDTKKKTAVSATFPTQRNYLRAADPARCEAVRSEGIKIGKEHWTAEVAPNGTRIKRMAGTKELAPVDLPLKYATLHACAPKGSAAYAVTFDEAKSVIALLGTNGSITWQVALEAHPEDIRVNGNDLVVATADQTRRVIAIDAKKGTIKWTATGPQPAK